MVSKLKEKRVFVWKIGNVLLQNVNNYRSNNKVYSENFEIVLGKNKTKCTKSVPGYCGLFAVKYFEEFSDYDVKFTASIQTTDNRRVEIIEFFNHASKFSVFDGWGSKAAISHDDIFTPSTKYLNNKSLVLIIKLELSQLQTNACTRAKIDTSEHGCTFRLSEFFNSKDFSDFTIICGENTKFPVHRCILSHRSSVFKNLFTVDMIESKENYVEVEDIDAETMLEVLRYIYTGQIEKLDRLTQKILYAAEKYDLQNLKAVCISVLVDQLSEENVLETLVLADRYNDENLFIKCMDLINFNFEDIKISTEWIKTNPELILKIMQYINASCIHTGTFFTFLPN